MILPIYWDKQKSRGLRPPPASAPTASSSASRPRAASFRKVFLKSYRVTLDEKVGKRESNHWHVCFTCGGWIKAIRSPETKAIPVLLSSFLPLTKASWAPLVFEHVGRRPLRSPALLWNDGWECLGATEMAWEAGSQWTWIYWRRSTAPSTHTERSTWQSWNRSYDKCKRIRTPGVPAWVDLGRRKQPLDIWSGFGSWALRAKIETWSYRTMWNCSFLCVVKNPWHKLIWDLSCRN